ncbi:MAG: translation initiation factor IF-3 [Hyphomicrobiales bacterium]|nr:translation initiation factor IF-3 [Hyphomicrobiales bacterium]
MSTSKDQGPRINEDIRSPTVRLIDHEGTMLGDMPVAKALQSAEAAGLDLVELNPNANPPICKLLDYGKFRYEAQKKAKEAKKHQKVVQIKEIKLRPTIDQHDYDVKLRNTRRFIEEGNKVKVTLRFRGREVVHEELGFNVLKRLAKDVEDIARVEVAPRLDSRQITMMLAEK